MNSSAEGINNQVLQSKLVQQQVKAVNIFHEIQKLQIYLETAERIRAGPFVCKWSEKGM